MTATRFTRLGAAIVTDGRAVWACTAGARTVSAPKAVSAPRAAPVKRIDRKGIHGGTEATTNVILYIDTRAGGATTTALSHFRHAEAGFEP